MHSKPDLIPLYSFDGKYETRLSLSATISRLTAGTIIVIRDRKGNIRRAERRAEDGSVDTASLRGGTKYSYREHLKDGHACYDLRRLDGKRDGLNYAPEFMRPAFLAVIASVSQ